MREFGGFFGLEAARIGSRHAAAKAFSTFSGALQQFLGALGDSTSSGTIWMPVFLCPQVETAIARAAPGIAIRRYRLRQDLEPLGCAWGHQDFFYYYNVFGLKGAATRSLPVNAIVDNAHASSSLRGRDAPLSIAPENSSASRTAPISIAMTQSTYRRGYRHPTGAGTC